MSTQPETTVMRAFVPALFLLAACSQTPAAEQAAATDSSKAAAPNAESVVQPGIEVFVAAVPERLRGKRVAFLTNHSAVDRAKTPDIDLIAKHKDLKLVALLAPEHGIRGTAPAGDTIRDETDSATGVPVYSLYKTEDQRPTTDMLKDADFVLYDLLEVGGRTWTYVSSMALTMQAAKARGIPFVVLDRPNPIRSEERRVGKECSDRWAQDEVEDIREVEGM